jgi:polysaccharide export outer membrane protein
MRKYFAYYLFFWILLLGSACNTYRQIPYFQNLPSEGTEVITNYVPLTIQVQDVLAINVNSLNNDVSALFNYNLNRINGNNNENSVTNPVQGYTVDEKGEISLPYIGQLKVAGLSITELRNVLQKRLAAYTKEPVVNIRIVNFKVSVLGDVLRPDMYRITNERVTITEALSMAGDLNITALRTNVLIVREQQGQRHYYHLDLTSKDIFSSPYYFLRNNDVIYVQPDKTKFATVDRGYRTATLVLSGLSILAIVLSTILR